MIETHANSAYNYPLLIKHLWHTPLSRSSDQEIVSGLSKRFTYHSIYQRIGKLAAGLSAQGVKQGDTVAVMDWDNHRYFECFFAVPMMGAVLHTINIRLSPEQILYTINHAEDDVILVHADFLPIVNQISDRFERPIKLIFLTDDSSDQLPKNCSIEFDTMIEQIDEDFEFKDFDENTIATTFYTTGTTGDPKGVFYSHRQLVLHTLGIIATLSSGNTNNRLHTGDVYMPITPMFHVHAWGFPYAATLLGLKQVYPGRYEPTRLLKLLEKEKVTFTHCVPTILNMLLSAPEAESTNLKGWKVIIGGSAMPKGMAIAAAQKGISAFTAYGMSETCPIVSASDMTGINDHQADDSSLETRCKTGAPAIMVELRVVDADMNDIATGGEVTGEVVMRAPWLTQGYTGSPEKSEELWRGGYLHTGDVGYIDDTGSLRITDRIKDVIKSGGEWISSIQLEDIVSRCEGITDVAAFGVPDARWGERPMLVIVKANEELTIDIIKTAVQSEVDAGVLSHWAIPERIEFVDVIPKTSVGKLDKKVMRKTYGETV
jgi:fatty-acyl-CoA synthase